MSEKSTSNLLEQQSALVSYLDDMLYHATETPRIPESDDNAETFDLEIIPPALMQTVAVIDTENAPVETPDSPVEDIGVAEKPTGFTSDMFPLQCLMFKVGENLLSMPLTELNSVVPWQNRLTRLPGEPDWIMGVLKHRDKNIRVVDSAAILKIKREVEKLPKFILVLGDEKWGISCDQIEQVINLNYDDVQWSHNRTNPMALGTIRDSLSSLLNPQGIISCLSG